MRKDIQTTWVPWSIVLRVTTDVHIILRPSFQVEISHIDITVSFQRQEYLMVPYQKVYQ
jgi:hypothetical protein